MKKSILLVLFTILASIFTAQAQDAERYSSTRLDNLANRLKGYTVDLVDRTSNDLRRGNNNSRNDIEEAFLAHQLDASAGLFQQMVRDNSRAAQLRDAAGFLTDLTRRIPGFGRNNNLWRNAQNTINDINRELGGNYGGNNPGNNNPGNNPSTGRAYWRGMVDNRVQLEIRGLNLVTRSIEGRDYGSGTFSFTSGLPRRNVSVDVIKKSGRGNVRVIQHPRRDNDYTAIIEIHDEGSGARDYQLEIVWR